MIRRTALSIMAGALGFFLAGSVFIIVGSPASPLSGRPDAVIVKGKMLPRLALGARREQYRLFAQAGSTLKPVPFQIDEYDTAGNIILQKGSQSRSDSVKGAFNENDELVFMAFDSASRVSGKPSISGCDSIFEISITDSQKGSTGYVYLARCSNPAPLSPVKYVEWDEARRTAITKSYKMGWQLGNLAYYDYLSIFDGPDLLDRLKVRISVGKGSLRKVFTEEDFYKKDGLAYLAGPVRVVYANRADIRLGPLGSIPAPQFVYFYRDWVYLHNELDFRFNPAVLGLDFEVEVIHDFSLDKTRGYKICSNAATAGCIAITGRMTPEVGNIKNKMMVWGGIWGPEGAMITRFAKDPRLPTISTGIYLDDDSARHKPEYIPGSSPEIGFRISNWKGADKGVYFLDFYNYFMKTYLAFEVARFDRMLFEPLKVAVATAF